MTKKEFLESRGYECVIEEGSLFYDKEFNKALVSIHLTSTPITTYFEVYSHTIIRNQKDIDALQIAFNNGKRDFEEMMELED